MSEININTEAVEQAAILLTENNNNLQNQFGEVNQAMERVTSNWKGRASDASLHEYRKIREIYFENPITSRYSVMKNHINYLTDFINPEIKKTDDVNTRLASKFTE